MASDESDDETSFLSWGGTVGATLTVLVTTLDDSVWLLGFVGTSALAMEARLVHAATFLGTLVGLAMACCLVAVAIQRGVGVEATNSYSNLELEELELKWEVVAAAICWLLAAGFCIKKQIKKRRRRHQQQHQQQQQQPLQLQEPQFQSAANDNNSVVEYGSLSQEEQPLTKEDEEDWHRLPKSSQPWTVVSLTALGFLDEISFFPALVIGGIFTVWELCVGTLLAGLLILSIQVFLATQCKPLIDFLDDRVPLYGIIAAFATILTLHLLWDLMALLGEVDYS
jgi:hypothetical protein